MKATKISLVAALVAGVLVAYNPAGLAQDAAAKDATASKDAPKSPSAPGAPGGQRAEAAKERLNKLSEDLKLTDEQKPKVEALLREQQEKMRGSRGSTTTPEERREKMKAVREEMTKKMKNILTPEQFAKWEKMPQMGPRPGGPGGPGAPGAPVRPDANKKASENKAE